MDGPCRFSLKLAYTCPRMTDFFKTFIILWAVIDPIGTIPVFLEATKSFDEATKRKVAIRAPLIAFGILLFFNVIGQIIMEAMLISLPAFQISGFWGPAGYRIGLEKPVLT